MTLGLPSIRPIPADALPALLAYKYNAIDRSLLSKYVLQPYWTWLVQFVPSWVAPNLVTLTGLLFIVANVLTLWALTGLEMESSGPAWMYYWFGLGLFAYTSLDAIDGKQARKTNTSGPLGELFDHGCDAINTFLGTIIITHVTGVQNSWWHLAYLFIGTSYFFLVTWETYHTGTLALGIINGPVEGTMLLTFFFLMTGYTGQTW
ncbi:hypothetical protein H696_02013 [Fonticula alba]|uniref:Ethanolaminephosphotransferase n=1 Tax=Fonticula alba TaxID=691883 RepID=A0A058ZAW5_FONAL|nr:hypothetical protein H696_02013 [Fonticula alba]KCV71063.1 hypothetical protein H696_02013 [Fonticula alba]|eukprot:XP_009494186.1 hypothetical protein H696_02013 [Fonticula alba]